MKKAITLAASLLATQIAFADINIADGYVRAVAPGQKVSAAFMHLSNTSNSDVSLVAAQSPAAKTVELHTHSHENGVMSMRQVEKIDVTASGSVALKPGGFHIMLIGLTSNLVEGETTDLTLEFSDGTTKSVSLPVKSVVKKMQHKHKH